MLRFDEELELYLYRDPIDLRPGISMLLKPATLATCLTLMASHLFVFGNRHCDSIKTLYWGSNGFWLLIICL
ncbi:IS66 Orf2 family protein [Burkholderia lata]|uniref:IS66 Orf2 family protein n=1 Tax=Burkholderia lata (strain ATCC 17760 / DSM 23089 / LMG 22485 / NCIMB 9086 / R18194 / 383) TaxID=482957 RepID=A0A6P2UZL5_BURL3|nr:IS66 family insertion sequence element accessory protein TnpB [Burkholderia lata]VWC76547.1 IS66 Orf2 family protein [Burkholderia lata]